jgi:hypothetical protein
MAATNKRLLVSESHGDSNRCIPCKGKVDQHDTYAFHASSRTPSIRFLWAVPVRGNLSQTTNSVVRTLLLPRKRSPDTIPSPAEWSTGSPPSFSPNTAIEAVMKAKHLSIAGYYRHAISTFNTCSRVPTPRSLTDTGSDYHIENLRIVTALSPPFLFKGSTDPPNGPVRSQIIHNNYQLNWRLKQPLNLVSGSLHSTSIVTYHLRIAWANDFPPR